MPIKILNSRCLSQILLNQNMALRSLSQSLSKSDFISISQLHSSYFIFVQFTSLPANVLFFHHTCILSISVATMFVFSFQSKLKACQGSILLEDIKFEKQFKSFNAFRNFIPRGRDHFGQHQEIEHSGRYWKVSQHLPKVCF